MDTGFYHGQTLGSAPNRHANSFQSSAINSTSKMVMMGHNYPMNSTATTSTRFLGNSSTANSNSGFTHSENSGGSVPGLKHDTGLAVEWSVEEQRKLEEGLSKFADEPSIMRYIKIAATMNDKTVRDVALRCRWMARKRKKQDEPHVPKKLKDKKDNLVVSSSKPSISSVPKLNVAPFSVAMNNRVQMDGITFQALSGSIKHLLEQNNQVLSRISANISSMKLQDNIDLFSHMKNNITAILNDMRYMPGPPFPVSLNEDLARSILPPTNQRMVFEASNGMYMKQEPEY
ncbi:hypothetical protein L1987_12201 [Smallanthus sonchifolius]|uniref:Uncharacterized protein n=1 Tax=Smallanthus sonchifolius TaxID=185202 RepID=A0ACB9JF76_9ASTR|nr:hypothetical protein L1987_12201 [Smallanthus sonchifolius]